jgi:Uncharacterized conserved protein
MYDILILDTGVTDENEKIKGLKVDFPKGKFDMKYGILTDEIGHGTIIYNIIRKYSPSAKILAIKLFTGNNVITEDELIYALCYIKENISCKVINMSLGLKFCEKLNELKNICNEIISSGTVIVSAFDNDNCYSYPAAFDKVIGVDSNNKIKISSEYEYIESSPINIRAKGGLQRIKLKSGKIEIVGGSSIACAYISSVIANFSLDEKWNWKTIMHHLRKGATRVYNLSKFEKSIPGKNFKIKKAAIFPFNKEMQAFIRYEDMLSFQIEHIYDIRQSGRVGMKMSRFYEKVKEGVCIEDIDKAKLNDIDTIIIGHLEELNEICGIDFKRKVIEKAVQKGINIYSFDPLDNYIYLLEKNKGMFYYPKITIADVPQNTFGKLHKINKPVVGIFGTSSKQGKFSLQLSLKKFFEEQQYRIGCIGTEPHSILFDMDCVYPMGYNSTVNIDAWQSITYLNAQLYKLCEKDVELIMVASQANSIPQNFNNIIDYPIKQNIFLMGTQPDAIILCINYFDEISYIKNTIQALQGISHSKVIALVMHPYKINLDFENKLRPKEQLTLNDFDEISVLLKNELKIPVYLLGVKEHICLLYKNIIDFF